MPYIPHTDQERDDMLSALGLRQLTDLFSDIPSLWRKAADFSRLPVGESEAQLLRDYKAAMPVMPAGRCFIGAGAYEHAIPSAIWQLLSRGELLTAYTPYQAEASQATLQLIFQFQTMMSMLTGMSVCNASMYDGATALLESIFMAVRAHEQETDKLCHVWLPHALHPHYRQVLRTGLAGRAVVDLMDFDTETGQISQHSLTQRLDEKVPDILVLAQPNFFGVCEAVDECTDWAHAQGAVVVACVNPLAIAMLKPPGQWGKRGADIVCGDVQPFGIPLSLGGPYCGFIACQQSWCRQMPGRLVARTKDTSGQTGYTLTLQTREQHIRRAKARSNICTNQALLLSAAVLYMRLKGGVGLVQVAEKSHRQSLWLLQMLSQLPGVRVVFQGAIFHEFVIRVDVDIYTLLMHLRDYQYQAGMALCDSYPQLGNALLICVTETKTKADLNAFLQAFRASLLRVRTESIHA